MTETLILTWGFLDLNSSMSPKSKLQFVWVILFIDRRYNGSHMLVFSLVTFPWTLGLIPSDWELGGWFHFHSKRGETGFSSGCSSCHWLVVAKWWLWTRSRSPLWRMLSHRLKHSASVEACHVVVSKSLPFTGLPMVAVPCAQWCILRGWKTYFFFLLPKWPYPFPRQFIQRELTLMSFMACIITLFQNFP